MIPWNQAYQRVAESQDFKFLFGKRYAQDDFRYYGYGLKFNALQPATLAAAVATPNTGSIAQTRTDLGAPTTNIVPGAARMAQINFAVGAVILGISAAAIKPQRIANNGGAIAFTYGPSRSPGNRDLFSLNLTFADTTPIVGSNPISEIVSNPNAPIITAPPIAADALMGNGEDTDTPARELFVAPGLAINVSVSSLVLPDSAPASPSLAAPNLTVHLVFHCMIPGIVTRSDVAA